MNGQIVLCKGFNDGEELERSIRDLTRYLPHLKSVSVVPVGLSKYRDGLEPLEPFEREDAKAVIGQIRRWQEKLYPEYGLHFVHASDEWYVLAGEELPPEETYDGYLQLENGVGMLRLMMEEFEDAMERLSQPGALEGRILSGTYSSVTGQISYPYIRRMADRIMERFPDIRILVYPIRNDFFGERITVTGLLTGQDILRQLRGKELGEILCLPENLLRSGEHVLLDDITVEDIAGTLQVRTDIVKSSGYDFVDAFVRKKEWNKE